MYKCTQYININVHSINVHNINVHKYKCTQYYVYMYIVHKYKKMYIVHIHRNVHNILKNLWELIHSLWINWNPQMVDDLFTV